MYSLCPPWDKRSVGKEAAHHEDPLQSQEIFMLLLGQRWGRYFNALSKYQQEFSREKHQKSIHPSFCRKLNKEFSKSPNDKNYLLGEILNDGLCFNFRFLLEGGL